MCVRVSREAVSKEEVEEGKEEEVEEGNGVLPSLHAVSAFP